jgi:hypothetical protein
MFLSDTVFRTALGPPSLLSSGYLEFFPLRGVRLTTYLHLVPRSNKTWSYISTTPWHLHGVVLSYLYRLLFSLDLVAKKLFWPADYNIGAVVISWTNCAFGLYPSSGVSKNKQNWGIKKYRQSITIHTSTKITQGSITNHRAYTHTHINPWSQSNTGGNKWPSHCTLHST